MGGVLIRTARSGQDLAVLGSPISSRPFRSIASQATNQTAFPTELKIAAYSAFEHTKQVTDHGRQYCPVSYSI